MEMSKNAQKGLEKLPIGMQAQILTEIRVNKPAIPYILKMLESKNAQERILRDQNESITAQLETSPGRERNEMRRWVTLSASFRNQMIADRIIEQPKDSWGNLMIVPQEVRQEVRYEPIKPMPTAIPTSTSYQDLIRHLPQSSLQATATVVQPVKPPIITSTMEKKLEALPIGMQAQIFAEIQGNSDMRQRLLMLLEKKNPQQEILTDLYSAMQEMIEPGSAPQARGAWPLTAKAFGNEIMKQKSQEARSAGLAGLGQDYTALATAFMGIAGPIVNAVISANTSPRGNIPKAAADTVAKAATADYSNVVNGDVSKVLTTPIPPISSPTPTPTATKGVEAKEGEEGSSKKWIVGGGVAVAAVGGIALLAILLTRKKKA